MQSGLSPRGKREYKGDEITWIIRLVGEGVPALWVAESLGASPETVRDIYRRHTGEPCPSHADFRRVWPGIRKSAALLALHQEFSPGRKSG